MTKSPPLSHLFREKNHTKDRWKLKKIAETRPHSKTINAFLNSATKKSLSKSHNPEREKKHFSLIVRKMGHGVVAKKEKKHLLLCHTHNNPPFSPPLYVSRLDVVSNGGLAFDAT